MEFQGSLEVSDESFVGTAGGPVGSPMGAEFAGGLVLPTSPVLSPRAKTSLRLKYEAESEVIRKKIGDLESIRGQLGLTQRKIAQLLLVDPSAWTRWTKPGEKAPPHVYRMLQWYLALQDKYPALDVNFWLNTVAKRPEVENQETKALLKEIGILKARIAVLEAASESGAGPVLSAAPREEVTIRMPEPKKQTKAVEKESNLPRILFFVMLAAAVAALIFGFRA